ALPAQLSGTAPFHAPTLHLAVLVRGHHVDPGMRVAEHELHELAFDRDFLALVVSGRERMMRSGRQSERRQPDSRQPLEFRCHSNPSWCGCARSRRNGLPPATTANLASDA